MSDPGSTRPAFRWGYVAPPAGGGIRRDTYEFYQLAPRGYLHVAVGLGDFDYLRPEGVELALAQLPARVELLRRERVDRIVVGGVPIGAHLGRDRARSLLNAVAADAGVPADSPLEAFVAAARHRGWERVAIASRWPRPVTERVEAYLREAGIAVLGSTTRARSLSQSQAMSIDEGMEMAAAVIAEAAAAWPAAEALFVPGGAALTLPVITPLEASMGRPIVTNLTAELWNGLLREGRMPPAAGAGTLLAAG